MIAKVVGNHELKTTRLCSISAPKLLINHMQPDDENKCGALLVRQKAHISQSPKGQLYNALSVTSIKPEYSHQYLQVLPAYPREVSRTIELSLQSSFQLSLTVLVRYRSRGHI